MSSPTDNQESGQAVKIGVPVGAGVGATGVVAAVWYGYGPQLLILGIGAAFAVATALLLKYLSARKQGGQAKLFNDGLGAQLRRTPGQVTDADSRAKLDDLRRKLQEGFTKLSSTGKSAYVLPWYLVVGEPGSGKTKAIAAASIALPGFQDPLQGAGGTVNMNWWFTNNGIILDTAGRLMLPEVATSNNPEWEEFLRAINQKRPNCPVNGLILVIPADTLITDDEARIAKKAGEIAYQFNKVQTTLGTRFPVFVLITKCDKILGFREFFEGVNQPDEQAQMLGWSNPDKLDDPFRPELVEQHLHKVHEQLSKRRLRLLQDPINTEDPAGRRLDQVDALYELPDALLALSQRLRRYLEPIFVSGPLSAKPLFLRGIYFTSSLQTGEALDKAIADIMGMDIATAKGESIVGEKPYFLRHFFLEKAFKEKGLVTRTTNVSQMKRHRNLGLIGAGFAATAAIMALLLYDSFELKRSIGNHVQVWDTQLKDVGTKPLLNSAFKYEQDAHLAELYDSGRKDSDEAVRPPWMFRPAEWKLFGGKLDDQRRQTFIQLFQSQIVLPLFRGAQRTMSKDNEAESWSAGSTEALRELLRVGSGAPLDQTLDPTPLAVFAKFALKGDDLKAFERDRSTWEDIFRRIYFAPPDGQGLAWPPPELINRADAPAMNKGVERFTRYCKKESGTAGDARTASERVADALDKFYKAEQTLLRSIKTDQPSTWDDGRCLQPWRPAYSDLSDAKKGLDDSLELARKAGWEQRDLSLSQFYQKAVGEGGNSRKADCDSLVKAIRPGAASLAEARNRLLKTSDEIGQDVKGVAGNNVSHILQNPDEAALLDPVVANVDGERNYQLDFKVIGVANGLTPDRLMPPGALSVLALPAEATKLEDTVDAARGQISTLAGGLPTGGRGSAVAELAKYVIELSARRSRFLLIDAVLNNDVNWETLVISQPKPNSAASSLGAVPLTNFAPVPPRFDPEAIKPVRDGWAQVQSYCTSLVPTRLVMDLPKLQRRFLEKNASWGQFDQAYRDYWHNSVPTELVVYQGRWPDFYAKLKAIDLPQLNVTLANLDRLRGQALQLSGAPPDPQLDQDRGKCLSNWLDLTADVSKARIALLQLHFPDFKTKYLLSSTTDTLTGTYWDRVFKAALKSLAATANDEAMDAMKNLNSFRKFPLAPTSDELDPKDLPMAVDLMKKLDVQRLPADPVSDDDWTMLRGEKAMTPTDADWLRTERPFAEALLNQRVSCGITFLPQDDVGQWIYAGVWQGGSKLLDGITLREESKKQVPLKINGDVELRMSSSAFNPQYSPLKSPPLAKGNWAALRLLGGAAKPDQVQKADVPTWDVIYNVTGDHGELHRIKLRLAFPNAPADLDKLVKEPQGERR